MDDEELLARDGEQRRHAKRYAESTADNYALTDELRAKWVPLIFAAALSEGQPVDFDQLRREAYDLENG